ncbi:hypothetical protein F2Q70_00013414 [Brassica cretica]|uniref:Uncharacterized protein n=2 Tax=Brassica TaxID=3705 RepID=A0A8S9M6Y5_BRACR|nr:hypothetical protein F2Q70_00013414 [Brassica cretica]VDC99976.1 unnamed protein product [Brassica oleracea]
MERLLQPPSSSTIPPSKSPSPSLSLIRLNVQTRVTPSELHFLQQSPEPICGI